VDSALVSVVGTDFSVATGRWGSFAFPDAPFGTVSISVSAPGHPTMVQDVEVKNGQVTYVEVVLPSVAATLRALLVRTGRPDAIRNAARSAADLLADKVPRTRANSGIVGKTDFVINLRGTSTLQGTEEPIILIDGVVMSQASAAFEALERIPASDVEEIQVLKGTEAFKYPYSANGVVNVVTKRGSGR